MSASADSRLPVPDRAPVYVEAPARLHFGMLDLGGSLGRRFGGIGAAVPSPSLAIEVAPAEAWSATGPDAARALEYARRFAAHHALAAAARITVHRALPAHAGLGSGTQLALAVARALAELHALPAQAAALARAVGRARRSAIGTWLFERGGFVLEGGRRCEGAGDEPAPLLAHLRVPADWRCVLVVPPGAPGVSGSREEAAFAALPAPPPDDAARVAHLVLMALLPALVEGELVRFGAALTEIQRINGRWFAPAQGGVYAPGASARLVERLREWGAPGVGQSSWGPAVYGIVAGEVAARALAARARAAAPDARVFEGAFAASGALVRRGPGGTGDATPPAPPSGQGLGGPLP